MIERKTGLMKQLQSRVDNVVAQASKDTTQLEKKITSLREDIKQVVKIQDKNNLDLETKIKALKELKAAVELYFPQPPVAVSQTNTFPQASPAVAPLQSPNCLHPDANGFYTTPGSNLQPMIQPYTIPLSGPVQGSFVQTIPRSDASIICLPQTPVEGSKTIVYPQTLTRQLQGAPLIAQVPQYPPNPFPLPSGKGHGPDPTLGKTSESISTAIVMHNCHPKNNDELILVKGSRVKILEKSDDFWWFGQYEDKIGWIPSTYIKEEKDE